MDLDDVLLVAHLAITVPQMLGLNGQEMRATNSRSSGAGALLAASRANARWDGADLSPP